MKLEDFLYTRGFREGACSDITIVAFGSRYPLHRLILDRSPFFSSCFNGGPWLESKSSEISLSPETSDPNITQYAFELALARLYGHVDRTEEDKNALPLMAAASYLDLQDLAESCVASLLRNLKTSNISLIVRFVTNSYYGHLTDRLLESAKALLYRDGYEMHFSEWDGISGDVAAEIAGYEGFYVPSEFERYKFVRNMINWRIKHSYSYPDSPVDEHFVKLASGLLKTEDDGDSCSVTGDDDADIRPLRELLEEGIYYVHMSFEELQNIAADRDILGRPTVSERTIRDALWQQMVLRQRVLNAPLKEARLGITKKEYVGQKPTFGNKSPARIPTPKPLGGKTSQSSAVPSTPPSNVDYLNPSLLGVSKEERRKYYIPTEDSTTVIGDCPEQPPQVIVSQRGVRGGNSTTSLPTDTSINEASTDGKDTDSSEVGEELCYSDFPPFRFSAEFRSVRTLKEKKRVYSKTVFYAGSYWNIYIQKVKSSKNVQLGVYLHRAKDREGSGSSGGGSRDGNDISLGKIDFDERALSLPEQRGRGGSDNDLSGNEGDSSILTTDAGDTTTSTFASSATARPGANTSASRASVVQAAPAVPAAPVEVGVPAMPHYVDSRPMIQTYFKIFSPSRKGKMLSMFSSGPDSFNFSQSWGWKSSSLILEEGLVGENDKDAKLRFMVVLGTLAPLFLSRMT